MKGHIIIDGSCARSAISAFTHAKRGSITPSNEYNSRGYRPVCFKEEGDECTGCTLCAITCPDIAIEVYRE